MVKTKKRRTHLRKNEELSNTRIPKSMVIRTGASNVGSSISQLTRDIRRMMEPHTAVRLRERKANRLKDYITISRPLGITHLLLLSKTESGPNMRIIRCPHGPTLYFRIKTYSLCKDIIKTQKKPRSPGSEFLMPPLVILFQYINHIYFFKLILNNFISGKKELPHETLLTSTFRNLFPEISVKKTQTSYIKRTLLLHRDPSKGYIDLRHYAIVTKNVDICQPIRRISTNLDIKKKPLPNLGFIEDISEYVLHNTGFIESDSEIEDDAIVEVKEETNMKNCTKEKVQKKAIKLIELGPRLQLELYKITEGASEGNILFHKSISNTLNEEINFKEEH